MKLKVELLENLLSSALEPVESLLLIWAGLISVVDLCLNLRDSDTLGCFI